MSSFTAETRSDSGCGVRGFSAIGDSGGGGMFVPAVRLTGSIKRAGSSNFPRPACISVLVSTLVDGMACSVVA